MNTNDIKDYILSRLEKDKGHSVISQGDLGFCYSREDLGKAINELVLTNEVEANEIRDTGVWTVYSRKET